MMSRKRLVLVLSLLVMLLGSFVFTGCAQDDETDENEDIINENIDNKDKDEDDNDVEVDEDEKNDETEEDEVVEEVSTDTATFLGRIDPHSIELRISGVQPDEAGIKAFGLSDELIQSFEDLGIEVGDEIRFTYVEGEYTNIIQEISKIEN